MNVDTIFSPAFGNRPSRLVGRQGVIDEFISGLSKEPGNRDRAIMLIGQRGSGKTVLLWELADQARERGFVVANPTVATDDMLERIIEKIQDDGERIIRERKLHLTGGSLGTLGFSVGLQFSRDAQESKSFAYKLAHLCAAINDAGSGVLVLIDEVRANDPGIRQMVAAYQELIGERRDIALVMAGLPAAVSETLNDRVLTFLNRARKVVLEPLAEHEVDAFFAQAFSDLELSVPDDIRKRAAQATCGSPYMLQLVGHNLVLSAHDDGAVDEATLDRAIAAAQTDFENDVCKTALASLSNQDAAFLRAMAHDDGESCIADVAERMGVTPDYAQKYRRRLIDAGVIEAPRRGVVAFAVPYLADYLRKDQ